MSWTKKDIVLEAFGELGLAGYVFDLSPEEQQAALRRLDLQMAMWAGLGINLGYMQGLTPTLTDLDDDSGLPLVAMEAVYLGLACRIAASKGKQVPATTRAGAKLAYDAMLVQIANGQLECQHLNRGTPSGAGNRRWSIARPFIVESNDPLPVDRSGNIDLGN